jgi:CheY-like chemotaxis protein
MRLNALLLCRDQQSLRTLAAALEDVEIEQEVCLSAPQAMEMLVQGHYSALVLDFDVPGATQVARMARLAPPQQRPVIFAMIGAMTAVGGTFQAGANFVLYKPLVFEQVTRSLRAGRGFMKADRRKSPRHKLETLVYLEFGTSAIPALVLDLSEHGLALQAPEPLPTAPEVPLHFVLPGTTNTVQGTGEMVWADDGGRAGMLFAELTPASRKHLKLWLHKRGVKKKNSLRILLPEKHSDFPHTYH